MKKLKLFSLIMALLCVAIFAFAGCNGNNNPPNVTEKDYCTVEFDSMGGSPIASQRILKGDTVSSPEVPTKESYSFLGWYKSTDENAEKWIFATDRVENDITLYAKWQSSAAQTPGDILDDILIVYFSYTGNTKGVANEIISQVNGVGVEIVPAIPYTAEDTSYDSDSRSKVEQSADARPEISEQTYSQIDLAEYDTVIIGYPIWNGYEPMIIRTFIEHYGGLSGKTVYTFSTSGSTDGSTAHNNIKSRCPNADVKDNLHFTSATLSNMQTLVSEWVANIKLKNEETNMEKRIAMEHRL